MGVAPGRLRDRGGGPPHRRVAFGGDREVAAGFDRRPGQRPAQWTGHLVDLVARKPEDGGVPRGGLEYLGSLPARPMEVLDEVVAGPVSVSQDCFMRWKRPRKCCAARPSTPGGKALRQTVDLSDEAVRPGAAAAVLPTSE